jgi:predicted permease
MRYGSPLRAIVARVRELVSGPRVRDEMDDEFAFHLQLEVEHNERQGMSHDEAVRAATLSFGGVQRMREETLDARGFVGFSNAARDLRFAWRRLVRRPAFAITSIATVALAIAATAAVGTIVHGVLLRPLPYPDAERLVVIEHDAPGLGVTGAGQAGAIDALYRSGSSTLEETGLYLVTGSAVSITDGDQPEQSTYAVATPKVLGMLGARTVLGRTFVPDDAGEFRILISHGLWLRRYGGDSSIIGRDIEVNRSAMQVVGVMTPSFDFPAGAAIWFPLAPDTVSAPLTRLYYSTVARLRPGVSAADAERELATLLPRLPERMPSVTRAQLQESRLQPRVRGLRESLTADVRSELVLLGVAVIVLLVIALVNLANLFLLQAEGVRREVAVSHALGARRSDVVRRFFTEGLIVAAIGGFLAMPIAAAGIATRFGFSADDIPRLREVSIDWRLPVVIGVLVVLIAAILSTCSFLRTRSGSAIGDAVRGGSRTTAGPSWTRVQRTLVGAQVALALALLASSALAGKSLWRLLQVDLHFDPRNTLVFDLPLPFSPYRTYVDAVRFHDQLLDSLRAIPGVTADEAAGLLPLRGSFGGMIEQLSIEGGGKPPVSADVGFASPDYFRSLSIPMLAGRAFQRSDLREAPAVIVTRSLATALGIGTTVGAHVRYATDDAELPSYEIVGIVEDQYGSAIADGPLNVIYFPITMPAGASVVPQSRYIPRGGTSVVVRTLGEPLSMTAAVRRVVQTLDPRLPMANVTTLEAMVATSTARARLVLALLAFAAATSLLLGMLGLYGVIAYSVAARHRDLGIRIAVGASPRAVMRSILGEGTIVTLLGSVAGIAVAVALGRVMATSLYGVSPFDPTVLTMALLLTITVSVLATWIPARRAAAIDPVIALRADS